VGAGPEKAPGGGGGPNKNSPADRAVRRTASSLEAAPTASMNSRTARRPRPPRSGSFRSEKYAQARRETPVKQAPSAMSSRKVGECQANGRVNAPAIAQISEK